MSATSSQSVDEHPHREATTDEARIQKGFERLGLRTHRFSIAHDSPHRPEDWDWNQRDILHVPFVHGGFSAIPFEVRDDGFSAFSVQNILGLRFPLLNAALHASASKRRYTTVLGPFVVVVEGSLEPLHDGGTRVRTDYAVSAKRPFTLLFPLIERFMRRNYKTVFDEDEPLRERRSELRAWGVRFRGDELGASYARSTRLELNEVILPPGGDAAVYRIRVEDLVAGTPIFLGRSDQFGVRVVREDGRVAAYPRLCPHAGACLDRPLESRGSLRCPWHGREVRALAGFAIGERRSAETVVTQEHAFSFDGEVLEVRTRRGGGDETAQR